MAVVEARMSLREGLHGQRYSGCGESFRNFRANWWVACRAPDPSRHLVRRSAYASIGHEWTLFSMHVFVYMRLRGSLEGA
eukprot:6484951-Alexandrium_andersonii.AAC.1